VKKFESAIAGHFPAKQAQLIHATFADAKRLDVLPVQELMAVLVKN